MDYIVCQIANHENATKHKIINLYHFDKFEYIVLKNVGINSLINQGLNREREHIKTWNLNEVLQLEHFFFYFSQIDTIGWSYVVVPGPGCDRN